MFSMNLRITYQRFFVSQLVSHFQTYFRHFLAYGSLVRLFQPCSQASIGPREQLFVLDRKSVV